MECPICYTEITPDVNCTITSCKHTFCMKCFISSVLQNNLCPCCRSELYEKPELESEFEGDDNYSVSDDRSTVYSVDSNMRYFQDRNEEPVASMDEIAQHFEQKGYTMLDLMQLVIPHRDYTIVRNTYDIVAEALNDSIEKADFDAKISYYERQIMEKEDYSAYK